MHAFYIPSKLALCDTQELFSPFIFTSLRATHRVGGHGARTHTHTHTSGVLKLDANREGRFIQITALRPLDS